MISYSFTGIIGYHELKIQFADKGGKSVSARLELYNLDKGLSLCRYRVYREAEGVSVTVKLHGEHIKGSPFQAGTFLPEDCHCPHRSTEQWLTDFHCPTTQEQVDSDLSQFQSSGIQLKGLYDRVAKRFPHTSFVHYSIIENKVSSQDGSTNRKNFQY